MASAPLVTSDPEAALPCALAPQALLGGEVPLLEPATVWGAEEQLLAALRGVEGEHLPVERAVRAVQVSDPAVVGAEAEHRRRPVARQRVLHDLLDRHAKAVGARRRGVRTSAAVTGCNGIRERHLGPGLQARLLAVVVIRALRPRRVNRSHRPQGRRREAPPPSRGLSLAVEPRKPGSFRLGKGREEIGSRRSGMGWDDRMRVGLCLGVWLLTVPRRIWKFVKIYFGNRARTFS